MADALAKYRAKRDFSKTAEPAGGEGGHGGKLGGGVFVVHKHAARRLHYDLRLEHGGVLWSWAVTRGPSLDPSEKRLAVHVEDHPFDYRTFEGNIPKGEYGGGAVIIWDEGEWVPEYDPEFGMKKGHIHFELKGEKLHGKWHLVRLKPRRGEKTENWLLIKGDDAAARVEGDILQELPLSVKSGLSIDEVAAGKTAPEKPRGKSGVGAKTEAKPGTKTEAKSGAKTAASRSARKNAKAGGVPLPDFVPPCLATLRANPPAGAEWVHEVKFDGYRVQARIDNGEVRLLTRTGLDWTAKFGRPTAEAFAALDCSTALIDGEIVVLNDAGASSFPALQQALSEGAAERMVFYAFDLLHLDGEDLSGEPLLERKERLRALVDSDDPAARLRYSEHFTESGETMLRHTCRMGLEGVVSKRADAPYASGRAHDWLKSKCTQRQEFVIVGYVPSEVKARGLSSLVVGYYEDGELRPAGRVGTGFTGPVLDDLRRRLDPLKVKTSALAGKPGREKGVVWVKPELVAEVEFRAWTDDRILRHASFQGLREDKPATEISAELPESEDGPPPPEVAAAASQPGKTRSSPKRGAADNKPSPKRAAAASRKLPAAPAERPTTTVELSNATKLLWPDAGVTKQGLLDHYALVWPRMEPYLVNRPLSLVRAPDGVGGSQRFFQKHASPGMLPAIAKVPDPVDGEDLLFVKDFDGLAALVQLGTVEIHVWGSTIDDVERPDQIVFDLDPDEGLDVEAVRAAALDVRRRLQELELPTFVKVSGGKGFHVVVPLKPRADWDRVKGFSHDFARAMAQSDPDKYTAVLSKKARKGRIFVDYLRNGRGATAIAPWSSRAKPKATVAVPISWEQLEDGIGPADFAIGGDEVADAVSSDDPWKDFGKQRKPI